MSNEFESHPTRRAVLTALATAGIGTGVFRRALAANLPVNAEVTSEMVQAAEWIAGIELDDETRRKTARSATATIRELNRLRAVHIPHETPISLTFEPAPGRRALSDRRSTSEARPLETATLPRPSELDELAFRPVTELAGLIRTREITSLELTQMYLDRLRRFDPALKCVVTLTEELATKQANHADREIAAGRYRGPLHGIPWGAKDLISVPGYPTTWGAPQFREQQLTTTATVARRLQEAGAVLVGKLSLGALAMGDRWFGGQTKNPWNLQQGSSGSSAGSAAATAAGLVGFAIGSETNGSIVSPSRRCGTTGLRPTFGRVSRHGCMTLSWTMDKLGPLCRSVEDCALVLGAIHGTDGLDAAAVDEPFHWPPVSKLSQIRLGYIETSLSDEDRRALEVFRDLGVKTIPVELSSDRPISELLIILECEAATVFDELTRSGDTQGLNYWPDIFRNAEFIPAVEYLRANRIRTQWVHELREVFRNIDVLLGSQLVSLTNLTGHPMISLPSGFHTDSNGTRTPVATRLVGDLFREEELLQIAYHYQQATGYHLEHPELPVTAE
ncbi:amidase [Thalassoroseus pseudoceratinae]|uniref:amidase n=1 Tax=Thalassoroseus pseudoceratinae TaxID=2713176 RepID=UPI0014235E8E|nr:amidase [Thalassoroseus pseudoceratinae]